VAQVLEFPAASPAWLTDDALPPAFTSAPLSCGVGLACETICGQHRLRVVSPLMSHRQQQPAPRAASPVEQHFTARG
jgi:hypothetical protein